ncbi:hypothetical protein JCGZ_05548 [Jatropha curcas]|uniref:FAS1 domain-containing protein n=1 Tax=Jatropha curcas TaxID=180498 RepID=A0A067L6I5_JATCU|nr:fasciclin-like arabinogalactan protein 12 [Jatropha curcas]KDP44081.1 hypothetical protein JCGZ_05548 [Jatropha curcas]
MKQSYILFVSFFFFFFVHFTKTLSQSPAPAPAPPKGPTNVIKILKKAGEFKVLIRLLKSTQLDSNLNSQLGNTNNGLTILAPSDSAFASLKKRTVSSLTHQETVELVQFHIIPMFISSSQFDTVTNPLKTHAGSGNRFQLNVTTNGNSVNITTGLTNTTISDTIYTDDHLAIYKVDKVLLPLDIFTPKPQTPAPAPATKKIDSLSDDDGDDDDGKVGKDSSRAVCFVLDYNLVLFGVIGLCWVWSHLLNGV